jgi:hypothetical protein
MLANIKNMMKRELQGVGWRNKLEISDLSYLHLHTFQLQLIHNPRICSLVTVHVSIVRSYAHEPTLKKWTTICSLGLITRTKASLIMNGLFATYNSAGWSIEEQSVRHPCLATAISQSQKPEQAAISLWCQHRHLNIFHLVLILRRVDRNTKLVADHCQY